MFTQAYGWAINLERTVPALHRQYRWWAAVKQVSRHSVTAGWEQVRWSWHWGADSCWVIWFRGSVKQHKPTTLYSMMENASSCFFIIHSYWAVEPYCNTWPHRLIKSLFLSLILVLNPKLKLSESIRSDKSPEIMFICLLVDLLSYFNIILSLFESREELEEEATNSEFK